MIKVWTTKKTDKYSSPDVQNEMLKIMSLTVLTMIAHEIQCTPFYSIMADETTDASNNEQLVICFRWVDDNLQVHEDFVGLHFVESIAAPTIFGPPKAGPILFLLSQKCP